MGKAKSKTKPAVVEPEVKVVEEPVVVPNDDQDVPPEPEAEELEDGLPDLTLMDAEELLQLDDNAITEVEVIVDGPAEEVVAESVEANQDDTLDGDVSASTGKVANDDFVATVLSKEEEPDLTVGDGVSGNDDEEPGDVLSNMVQVEDPVPAVVNKPLTWAERNVVDTLAKRKAKHERLLESCGEDHKHLR